MVKNVFVGSKVTIFSPQTPLGYARDVSTLSVKAGTEIYFVVSYVQTIFGKLNVWLLIDAVRQSSEYVIVKW